MSGPIRLEVVGTRVAVAISGGRGPAGRDGAAASVQDDLGGDDPATNIAPSQRAMVQALEAKVDAPGALAAAVGVEEAQAPARATLRSTVGSVGSSLIGYVAGFGSAVGRTVLDKWREHGALTPEDFGAVGDGTTDDTSALQAWLNVLSDGTYGRLGPKPYLFTSALTKVGDRVTIRGSGKASKLLYGGTATSLNLLTIGSPSFETRGYRLRDFVFESTKPLTGGAALKAYNFCRSQLVDVIFGGQEGSGNLFDGGDFEGVDYVWIDHSDIQVRGTGLTVSIRRSGTSAAKTLAYGVGFYVRGGKIGGCGKWGAHIGGGLGGVVFDDIDIINNGTSTDTAQPSTIYGGVKIAADLYATQNREIFFGNGCTLDGNTGYNLLVDDAMGDTPPGYIALDGTWLASASLKNIYLKNWGAAGASLPSTFSHTGGTNFNSTGQGLDVETPYPLVQSTGVVYRYNQGMSVRGPGAQYDNVQLKGNRFLLNSGGDTSGVRVTDSFFTSDLYRDANFYFGMSGASPVINFDTNDFMQYDRSGNQLFTYIGSVIRLLVSGSGVGVVGTLSVNGSATVSGGLSATGLAAFGGNATFGGDGRLGLSRDNSTQTSISLGTNTYLQCTGDGTEVTLYVKGLAKARWNGSSPNV